MSNYDQFRDKLREIFMMDHAELDFGIYRIMNQKRGEINKFLEKELLPQVKKILGGSNSDTAKALQQELDKAIKQCQELEIDPNTNKKVIELREKIDASSAGNEELENEVFDKLTTFFKRYYEDGDFVSKRRYKDKKYAYAIPYNGEEVKLHWANSDQYYIKTSEYFQNYTFNVLIDEKTNAKKKVHFVLKDVTTEQNNNKAASGMERRFALYQEEAAASIEVVQNENGEEELNIYFIYELMPKETKQDALMADAFSYIKENLPEGFAALLTTLCPTEKDKKRTLLQKHLKDYTDKNQFDYFIHKDLGGFLRRELDFYIKNEVLLIDDLDEKHVMQQLTEVRAIKGVGEKIITMLAQIEDFQKRLWLKKKFVVQSDYCITLDRVPESFYAEICENEEQRKEWVRLFAIDKITGDLTTEPYSEPLSDEFLHQNPYLVLDTALFSIKFKHQLLSRIEDMDKNCNGLLINSENYQALELLQEKYRKTATCIYADPPYNTNASKIVYKNNYKNSSWLSLMGSRLLLGKKLLNEDGIQCTTIDDYEQSKLNLLLEDVFEARPEVVAIRIKPSGRPIPNGFAVSHEYGLFSKANENVAIKRLAHSEEQNTRYRELDEKGRFFWELLRKAGSNSLRSDRPTMFFPFYYNKETKKLRIPKLEFITTKACYQVLDIKEDNEIEILPIRDDGTEGRWYLGLEKTLEIINELKVVKQSNGQYFVYRRRRPNEGVQPLTTWGDSKYSATEHGTDLLKRMDIPFEYPKSIHAVEDCLRVSGCHSNALVVDYFGGSGTTGHAVINLNKEDGEFGRRKYILIDMAEYFDKALRTRISRAIYSEDWKDGKPVSRKGISQCFKYIRLEQYEDTLNNLEVKPQGGLFDKEEDKDFRESYMLQYMMDMDTRDSLFNIERFVHPFDVKLKTTRDNELVETNVDMVETFNYLIGLEVDTIRWTHNDEICVVEGRLHRSHDKALVIWRDTEKVDNTELNAFFRRNDYHVKDSEFDIIFVNGDNTLQNQKRDDEHWKVVLIEEEFQKRMFEEC